MKLLDRTLILAHRGLHIEEKENTMAAFQKAIEAKADGFEFDVHLTKDKNLVVIHDFNTKRTSGVDLVVEKASLDEIKKADSSIPTLDEVFSHFKDTIFYDIELKTNNYFKNELEKAVYDKIKEYKLVDKVLVSSFNPFSIMRFNKIAKREISTSIIYTIDKGVPKLLQKGFLRHFIKLDFIKPGRKIVDKQIDKAKQPICLWCVDTKEEKEFYINKGVKIIISNRVDII